MHFQAKTILTRLPNALAQLKFRRWFARVRRDNRDLFSVIDNVLRRFHNSGGLRWIGQDFKLYHLWQLCVSRRPQSILEFGSGSSTALLAKFCAEYGSTVITIDESAEWLANTKKLCGIVPVQTIEFIHSKRLEDLHSQPPSCQYAWESVAEFDFVIVDGPSLNSDRSYRRKQICTNAIDVHYSSGKAMIAVDGRFATYRHLSRVLQGDWLGQASSFRMFSKTLLRTAYRSYSVLYRSYASSLDCRE